MKKKEFRAAIQSARESGYATEALCLALDTAFLSEEDFLCRSSDARLLFQEFFSPHSMKGVKTSRDFWLGRQSPRNTELRHHFLDAFEAYCLSSLSGYAYKRF
jgi:hypothetical protein